jgi:hypothetical protein
MLMFNHNVDKWKAFLRKGRLDAEAKSLPEVVNEIADFLLTPASETASGNPFNMSWAPGGPWQ